MLICADDDESTVLPSATLYGENDVEEFTGESLNRDRSEFTLLTCADYEGSTMLPSATLYDESDVQALAGKSPAPNPYDPAIY